MLFAMSVLPTVSPLPGAEMVDMLNDEFDSLDSQLAGINANIVSVNASLLAEINAKAPIHNAVLTGTTRLGTDPTIPLHAATKAYVDAADDALDAAKAPKLNPVFTGSLTLPGTPTAPLQAATKAYVDAASTLSAAGLQPKEQVVAATTTNITLANSQTVDGVAVVNPNRVLVKNQSTQSQNGIYVVTNSGAWVRATDMDAWSEVPNALVAVIDGGTANGGSTWVASGASGGTLGTTAITWALFSQTVSPVSSITTDTYTSRSFADRFADWVNVLDHRQDDLGATRSDTDMINAAIDYALSAGKTGVFIPPGGYELEEVGGDAQGQWAIRTPGVSIEARGAFFYAHTSMGSTCDWIRIQNGFSAKFNLRGFTLSGYIGAAFTLANRRGRYGIAFHGWEVAGITKMLIEDVNILDGFPNSAVFINNDPSVNLQGTPATSYINNCVMFGRVYFHGAGDSLTIQKCTIRARGTNEGIHFSCTDGAGGYGSQFRVTECNIVAGGGTMYVGRARAVKIENLNTEMNIWVGQDGVTNAAGTGSNGAMIDIAGDIGVVYGVSIRDCMLSDQSGTSTSLIRVASAHGVHIDDIRGYTTGSAKFAVTTGAASYTHFGPNNALNDAPIIFPAPGQTSDITDGSTTSRWATYTEPKANSSITVGASPYVYTNSSPFTRRVLLSANGASIDSVSLTLGNANYAVDPVATVYELGRADSIVVGYSGGTPLMRLITGL